MPAPTTVLKGLHPWWPLLQFLVSVAAIVISMVTLASGSNSDVSVLVSLQSRMNKNLDTLQESYTATQQRLASLEKSQNVAQLQSDLLAVQQKVTDLQSRSTPAEAQNLHSFGTLLSERQTQLADALKTNPDTAGTLPTLPSSVPKGLAGLTQKDRQDLDSLLGNAQKTRELSLNPPEFPKLNLEAFKVAPPQEKSTLQKVWDGIKAYPGLAVLVVFILIGVLGKR